MTERNDREREHEEVLCAYVLQRAGVTDDEREALAEMEWDPIAPELPGCIDTAVLRARARRWKWTASLEQLAKGHKPEARRNKGVKASTVSVAKWMPSARWDELVKIGLLRTFNAPKRERARCGLFGVEKVGKRKLRVIFDARPANERLEPRPEKLLLFTLPQLIDGFHKYRFVHTVDYRHYYYQFKLPDGLQIWFVIRVGARHYVPSVLPMGFREAVVIAQTATWVVVLHREDGESTLGIRVEDLDRSEMPVYVSLYSKGGEEVGRIYVLLDGVALVCNDEGLREAWKKRLERNEALFKVIRKEAFTVDLTKSGSEVDFAGVVFSEKGWQPRRSPEVVPMSGASSPAAYARRLGRILWAIRVRTALSDRRHGLLAHEPLMRLYQKIGAAGTGGWNRHFTLSKREVAVLIKEEAELSKLQEEPWPATTPPRPLGSSEDGLWLIATDAFTRGYGYVLYAPAPDGAVHYAWAHKAIAETRQIEAEAAAVTWAVAHVVEKTGRRPRRLVVAVDADSVRVAINKGYARSAPLRRSLAALFELCPETLAIRVPGVQNAADLPSRGKPPQEELVLATWSLLQEQR